MRETERGTEREREGERERQRGRREEQKDGGREGEGGKQRNSRPKWVANLGLGFRVRGLGFSLGFRVICVVLLRPYQHLESSRKHGRRVHPSEACSTCPGQ